MRKIIDGIRSSSMMEPATAENGWVSTIDSKNPEVIAKARHIIESNLYCVLSTCSPDGYPRVSPCFSLTMKAGTFTGVLP